MRTKLFLVAALAVLAFLVLCMQRPRREAENIPVPAKAESPAQSEKPGLEIVKQSTPPGFKDSVKKLGNFNFYGASSRSFVPDSVKRVFDKDADAASKMEIIRKLGSNLSREEMDALLSFVVNGDEGIDAAAVKNEILNKLGKQAELPPGLDTFLFNMAKSSTLDLTMRVYALQQMGFLGQDRLKDSPVLKEALNWALAQGPELSTTALVCLDSISAAGNTSLAAPESVAKNARGMLAQVPSSSPLAASVLQVAARNGVTEALAAARRNLAAPETTPPSTLLSSIAVVGMMGGGERDAALFNKLLSSERLAYCRTAINAASENIEKKRK